MGSSPASLAQTLLHQLRQLTHVGGMSLPSKPKRPARKCTAEAVPFPPFCMRHGRSRAPVRVGGAANCFVHFRSFPSPGRVTTNAPESLSWPIRQATTASPLASGIPPHGLTASRGQMSADTLNNAPPRRKTPRRLIAGTARREMGRPFARRPSAGFSSDARSLVGCAANLWRLLCGLTAFRGPGERRRLKTSFTGAAVLR